MERLKLSFETLPAIEGLSTTEDLVKIRSRCSLDCSFCIYGRGNVGSAPSDVLSPSFKLPVASRVTVLAGDLINARLSPLISRLRELGASEVLVYAHSGASDFAALKTLHAAGLTGLYMIIPAVSRDLLSKVTGGRGSIKHAAAIIETANALGLRITLEIPVIRSNHHAISDIVARALNRVRSPDRIIFRFLNEYTPGGEWHHDLARPEMIRAIEIAEGYKVPVQLAHPHAPPPCVINLPQVRPSYYPGLMIAFWSKDRKHPQASCQSCVVSTVCTAGIGHQSTLSREVEPIDRAHSEKTSFFPSSVELFLRQDVLGSLIDALRHRPFKVCRFPWEELEAHDIRGVVTPCAGGWPLPSTISMCTSWRDSSLLQAWNSPGMQAVRMAAAAGRPFETCSSSCPAFHGGPQTAFPPILAPLTRPCFENVVKNLREMLEGALVLSSKPQVISFSPTLRCINHCRMCDVHEMRGLLGDTKDLHEMPDALYEELLELLPTTRMLALTGGEPLLSSKLRQLLRHYSFEAFPDGGVTLTTNGLLLRQPILSDLKKTPIKLIYVSLNAATEATYEFLTGTRGGFQRVIKNVHSLLEALPTMAVRPTVVLSFVVQRSNYRELPSFLELARSLKLGVRLQPIERDRSSESIFTDEETLRSVLDVIAQIRLQLSSFPRSYEHEVTKIESILRGKLNRRDFTPL